MVVELCEDNADLLSSVTVLFLLSEENPHQDDELLALLSKYIHNLIIAYSVDDAKHKSEDKDIDILVADFSLSDSNSMDLPIYMRKHNPACSTIIYTSKNDPEHLLEAIELKVDKYIVRPNNNLKEIVKAIIYLAEYAFTLKSLQSLIPSDEVQISTEAYDVISHSIDELRDVIAKLASQHCAESMSIIHTLKGVIGDMKNLLKHSC